MWIGRESQFNHIHSGPYRVLLDKKGVLTKVDFAGYKSDQTILVILSFYRELARPLARTHGLTYPAELDRLMGERPETLSHTGYDERYQAVAR